MTNIFGYIAATARWIEIRANAVGRLLVSTQSEPILVDEVFNTPVALNTDFFAADLVPTDSPTTFRISIAFDTLGILNLIRTAGGVPITEHLNENDNLVADCLYEFNVTVIDGQTINLQHTVGGTILSCIVVEIYG